MEKTRGLRALQAFLKRHRLAQIELARALGVSSAAVHHWFDQVQRPTEPLRYGIQTWTKGEVPASLWMTAKERKMVQQVKPFEPSEAAPKKVRRTASAALQR